MEADVTKHERDGALVAAFQPSRADGRSDRVVVYDLVKDAAPETLFGYEQITEALQVGLDDPVTHARMLAAVRRANRDLLHKQQRLLRIVRGRGVRVIRSDEMLPAAIEQKAIATSRMKHGVDILRNTRIEELTEAMQSVLRGSLLIFDGFSQALQATERRQSRTEQAVENLLARVRKLEGTDADNGEAPVAIGA